MDTDVRFMDTDSYDDIYAEIDRVGKAFAGLVKMAREGQFKPPTTCCTSTPAAPAACSPSTSSWTESP